MRTSHASRLLAIVALALGLGAGVTWWLLGGSGAAAAKDGAAGQQGQVGGAGKDENDGGFTRKSHSERRSRTPTPERETPKLPPPADPTRCIDGRVASLRGRPISKVTVRLIQIDPAKAQPSESGTDGTTADAGETASPPGTVVTAVSDRDGLIRFDGLVPGARYWLERTFCDDWELFSGTERMVRGGEEVILFSRPLQTINVEVLLPDGNMPAEATIRWDVCREPGKIFEMQSPWSPEATILQRPAGAFRLLANVPGAGLVCECQSAVAAADGTAPDLVTLRMKQR